MVVAPMPVPTHIQPHYQHVCMFLECCLSWWFHVILPLLSGRSSLASFTVVTSLDLSYIITTNLSKACRSLSSTAEGHSLSFAKVCETSSHTPHDYQADFFDLSWKDDIMSQPVKAWKKRIPRAFSGPMAETPSWIGIHLDFSPLPKVTHICSRPSCIKEGITAVAIITTGSVQSVEVFMSVI